MAQLPNPNNQQGNHGFRLKDGTFVSYQQLADLVSTIGPTAAATQLGQTPAQLRKWTTQASTQLAAMEKKRIEQETKTQKVMLDLLAEMKRREGQLETQAAGKGMLNRAGANAGLALNKYNVGNINALQQLTQDHQASVPVLMDIERILTKQLDVAKKANDKFDAKTREDEENRQESIRKYGHEGGYGGWLMGQDKDKTEKKGSNGLEQLADHVGGFLGAAVGLLLDPKAITTFLGFEAIKTVLPRLLKSKALYLVAAVGMAAKDAIDAYGKAQSWQVSGLSAAVGGFLGGSEGGGMMSAVMKGTEFATIGATLGMAFGPIGFIAGALIGGALGGITGFIGSEKMAKMVDDLSNNLGPTVLPIFEKIRDIFRIGVHGTMDALQKKIDDEAPEVAPLYKTLKETQAQIADLNNQILAAAASGDDDLKASLMNRRDQALALNLKTKERLESIRADQLELTNRVSVAEKEGDEQVQQNHENIINTVENEVRRLREVGGWWSDNRQLDITSKVSIFATRLMDNIASTFDPNSPKNIENAALMDAEAEGRRKKVWEWMTDFSDKLLESIHKMFDLLNPYKWIENFEANAPKDPTGNGGLPSNTIQPDNPMGQGPGAPVAPQSAPADSGIKPGDEGMVLDGGLWNAIGQNSWDAVFSKMKPAPVTQDFKIHKALRDLNMMTKRVEQDSILGHPENPIPDRSGGIPPRITQPVVNTVDNRNMSSTNMNVMGGFKPIDSTFLGN